MIKGIAHVAFNVKDMDTTVAFYENTLGIKIELMQLDAKSPQMQFIKSIEE